MKPAYVLTGQVSSTGELLLDEPPSLPAGRVRIILEPLATSNGNSIPGYGDVSEEEWDRRKAVMDASLGCLSDEDAAEILSTIEAEFERIDPNDWR